MHTKQNFLIWLVVMLSVSAYPQQSLNTQTVDGQTYSLFMEKDWDGLIKLGNEALAAGIDFYYLHFRMGIAWHQKANYHKSLKHLNKAFHIHQDDPHLLEYLYYANLFLNRKQEAAAVAERMTSSQRKQLDITKDHWIEKLEVIFQTNQANSSDVTDSYGINNLTTPDGNQFLSKGHQFGGLFMQHPISSRLSIYHGFSHMRKNHFVFTRFNNEAFTNTDAYSNLNQYYLSGIMRVARNLTVIAGFHYINIRYPLETTETRGNNTINVTRMVSLNDVVGCLSVYTHAGQVTLGGSIYAAGLNNNKQLQGDGMIAWYPLGNVNLYTATVVSWQADWDQYANQTSRQVYFQRLGGRIARPLWLEGFVSIGDMQNFLRYDALMVFNTMDMIKQQLGTTISYQVTDNIFANISYTYAKHESSFIPDSPGNQPTNTLQYDSHSLTGGIAWIF